MLLLHAIYFMYTAQLEVHTKDKKKNNKNQNNPAQDLVFKRANIHLPPAECCSAGTF